MFNMQKVNFGMKMLWICALFTVGPYLAFACSEEEFSCGPNDKCIPLEWVCDNIKDCPHGQDESSCHYLHVCPDGDLMCRTGECVSMSYKCDGNLDCSDGSDEVLCPKHKPTESVDPTSSISVPVQQFDKKPVCGPSSFVCEKSGKCIDKSLLCDGRADCEYMEDEQDCKDKKCASDKQLCADGSNCYIKCDGFEDCADGSDEAGCDYEGVRSFDEFFSDHFHACDADMFKCKVDGKCLQRSLVCDGQKDCLDGEDEGGLCGSCTNHDCEYKCIDLPTGPECSCPEGSFLTHNFKTCEKENLCNTDNQCNQLCKSSGMIASCYCAPGYVDDGNECKVSEMHTNGELFMTHGAVLRRSSIFNVSGDIHYEDVFNLPSRNIPSVSLNPNTDSIYLISREDLHKSYIYEVKSSQGGRKLLTSFGLKNIAVDWVTGNIYYTADGPYPGVGVCTPDGLYCKQLVDGTFNSDSLVAERYSGLIVHPQRGILIWLSYNADHPEGQIHASGMDGTDARTLSTSIHHPKIQSIAMDYVRDYLFVVQDNGMQKIDLHTLKSSSTNHFFEAKSMLVFNGHYYFIASDAKLKKTKFDSPDHEVVRILTPTDTALTINNSIYYAKLEDPCQTTKCSHICVLTEKQTAKCVCPDQYAFDASGKCLPIDHHASRVKMSADRMLALCGENKACLNGGSCYDSYNDTEVQSPSCRCLNTFIGLYCEVPTEGPLLIATAAAFTSESSSSGWATFFWVVLVLIIIGGVIIYFVHKKYPHVTDRLQHMAAFSPYMRRMNSSLGIRVNRRQDVNVETGTPSVRAKSHSMSDLSKASNFSANPLFGSSPSVALSKQDNAKTLPSLHKSPSAECKLNLEE